MCAPNPNPNPNNDNTANSETTEQTRQAIGPFNIPADYEVVTLPAGSDTQGGWENNCRKKKWWSGKRLAHIFDDNWLLGTYQKEEKLRGDSHFIFFYKDGKPAFRYAHGLRSMGFASPGW